MKIRLRHNFEDLISVENLLKAWQEFASGKRSKLDVQKFSADLFDNILQLHNQLANKTYRHGGYYNFNISDPKPRKISKASVQDRLVHHAVYRVLYPFFERTFIADSFSCRIDKGTHKSVNRFLRMFRQASHNNTKGCWVLKCDIKKFFATIDHEILINILEKYIPDKDIIWLVRDIISSFSTSPGVGLPLGNLTSQLFVNVYMNEFDQYVKHKLKARYYIRYADDFVFLSQDRNWLLRLLPDIRNFLYDRLKLAIHPTKIKIKSFGSGVDFLGWVNFPTHKVLRTTTKNRMLRRVREHPTFETLQSYLGLLEHGNTAKVSKELLNTYWLFIKR